MIIPRPATLKKYGLTQEDWIRIYESQNGCCPVCGNPLTGRTNIDHFHARQWSKKSDADRKKFVRGILCFFCNKYYLGRGVTIERLRNAIAYLERFEKRKPK